MNSPNVVFGSALIIISLGYLLKSFGFIKESDAKSISRFLMHTTFPALIFTTMIRVELHVEFLWLPIICLVFGCVSSLIGFQVFKNESPKYRGVLSMSSAGFNLGIFAYPLIEGVFGMMGLTYAIMFDLGNSFINFMVNYGVGNYLSENSKKGNIYGHIIKRIFSLPALQAMVFGLIVNIYSFEIPTLALDILDTMAKGNKPIVLLLMGIYFSARLPKETYMKVFKVLGIRYFLGLSVGLLFYYTLPFQAEFRNMLLVCLILPVGMTIITYSEELKFDTSIAAALVNISLLVSFSLMWFLVWLFHMAPM